MTEAQFISFVKSALRSKSRFWLPASEVKKAAKRAYGLYECAQCHQIVRAKDTVIDHIEPVVDPYQNPTDFDWNLFIERLFCEKQGLQLLCKLCHTEGKTAEENSIRRDIVNYATQYPAEYNSWRAMYRRCYETTNNKFYLYGGRGIKVCDDWSPVVNKGDAFKNFLRDMGPRPEGTTLDRIDGEKDYTPENCRWSDIFEQNRNRKSVIELEIDGQIYTFAEACKIYGICTSTAQTRLSKGMSLVESAQTPPRNVIATETVSCLYREGLSCQEIAEKLGAKIKTIRYHLTKINKGSAPQ